MPDGIRPARYFSRVRATQDTSQIGTTTRENFASGENMDKKYDLKLISLVNHAPGRTSRPHLSRHSNESRSSRIIPITNS